MSHNHSSVDWQVPLFYHRKDSRIRFSFFLEGSFNRLILRWEVITAYPQKPGMERNRYTINDLLHLIEQRKHQEHCQKRLSLCDDHGNHSNNMKSSWKLAHLINSYELLPDTTLKPKLFAHINLPQGGSYGAHLEIPPDNWTGTT